MLKKFLQQLKLKPKSKSSGVKIIFDDLYKDICGEVLSKQDRSSIIKDDCSLVYGEIIFESFIKVLEEAGAEENEIFYDLGSGIGKAVITAALTQPFAKCVGIEILPSLYAASMQRLNALSDSHKNGIQFIQEDFYDVDITEADIVFINATGFFGESLSELSKKLETLKEGSRIIITSKLLKNSHFKLAHQDFYLMSWGYGRVSIYRKN